MEQTDDLNLDLWKQKPEATGFWWYLTLTFDQKRCLNIFAQPATFHILDFDSTAIQHIKYTDSKSHLPNRDVRSIKVHRIELNSDYWASVSIQGSVQVYDKCNWRHKQTETMSTACQLYLPHCTKSVLWPPTCAWQIRDLTTSCLCSCCKAG